MRTHAHAITVVASRLCVRVFFGLEWPKSRGTSVTGTSVSLSESGAHQPHTTPSSGPPRPCKPRLKSPPATAPPACTKTPQVIKKRSADAYVFPLTLSVFINCLVWTGWGIGIMDTTYIFTSAWGMMLSGAQLILVAAFWKNDKLAREARKAAAKAAEASAHEGDAGDDGVCGSLSLSDDGVAVVNVDADLGTGVVDVTACADGHARTPKQKKKRRFGSDSSCAGESNGSDVSPLSLAACEACKEGGCKSQGECGCDKVAIEGQLVGALVGEGVKLDHVVDIDELSESKAAASLSGERGEGDVAPR